MPLIGTKPSTFQTSDIELLSPKIETEYTSH